ncbi:hypothetical protein T265_06387 [Opisthorchis viverrini]|uniref:Uncharacterized protein n=1 Tax=Opisthorchis viverrini TaxID=6198 RepID=A0A074ZSJ7_OPIVI|nr:hypothetical protein T265_06387 [Opisthorchis viverrini]KER26340.1 hypothetical protein T265_06387 [Opisthorchis viverrini]
MSDQSQYTESHRASPAPSVRTAGGKVNFWGKNYQTTDSISGASAAFLKNMVVGLFTWSSITEQPMEPADRTTNRDLRSTPASSMYINTQHYSMHNHRPITMLPNNVPMMSPRLVMKRLQSNCSVQ